MSWLGYGPKYTGIVFIKLEYISWNSTVAIHYSILLKVTHDHFAYSWINLKVNSNHEITQKRKRKIFLLKRIWTAVSFQPIASVLPMSYADPYKICLKKVARLRNRVSRPTQDKIIKWGKVLFIFEKNEYFIKKQCFV